MHSETDIDRVRVRERQREREGDRQRHRQKEMGGAPNEIRRVKFEKVFECKM